MVAFCGIFFMLSLAVFCNAKIVSIEKVEIDIDSVYIKASPKLVNDGGINKINLDIEILKEESDVMYQAVVFRHNVDHYEQFYKSEMESGCKPGDIKDPILVFMFKESMKYGNLTAACPLKIGHYQLAGFMIDSADLPHQMPPGSYRFDFSAYIKKDGSPHEIYTDKYYFKSE